MALKASDVLTRANDLLLDAGNTRWSAAELLRWLNDGRRELAITRPDLYAVISVVALISGTKQTVPTDGTRFIDAIRNVNVDDTPGAAVRIVEREDLDAQYPGWHQATAGATANFMFDERVPKTYWVYPPAVTGAKLEIAYSQEPVEVTDTNTTLTQEGLYANALVDYIIYRAFSKDSTFAANAQRAAAAYTLFKSAIGEGDARDLSTSPNVARTDGNQPRGGG